MLRLMLFLITIGWLYISWGISKTDIFMTLVVLGIGISISVIWYDLLKEIEKNLKIRKP